MGIEDPFKSLEEGSYTYYTIQSKMTHASPWCQPNKPLVACDDLSKEWIGMVGKYIAEPWDGDKPKFAKSSNEMHDVWAKTGGMGWWSLKHAIKAMERLRKGSDNGLLNFKDCYGYVTQAVRYKFRIVKVSVSKHVELISIDDILDVEVK